MDLNPFLRNSIIFGLCALTLVPLFVANGFFFPFITGKNFAFRILVELIFALWALLALRDASVRPKPHLVLYAVGAFVVSLGISAVLGENFNKSFWSNFERMEGWIGLLHLGLYFFLITVMFQGEKMWKYFFNTTIAVSVVIAFYGLFQLAGLGTIHQGGVRVDATLGNATYLAVYMLFHMFITALSGYKWGMSSRALQAWYGFAFLLQGFILFSTATRGTILGLVAGVFVTGFLTVLFSKGNSSLKKYGAGVLVGLVLMVGGFFLIKDTELVKSSDTLARLASISLSEGQTRFTVWSMAFKGFVERPLFGWGQENFSYVFNKYYEPSLYNQEPWFDRAHNVVLDWLIAGGVVGFLLYVSVYVITLWYLSRPEPSFPFFERALIIGLLVAHAIHNFFVFDNLISYMFFLTVIAYVAYRAHPELGTSSKSPALSPAVFTAGAPIIVIVFFIVFYFINVPGMVTATTIIEGIRPHTEGTTKNFEYFVDASNTNGLGRQEVREQLVQFALQIRKSNVGEKSFQDQTTAFAIQEMKDEIDKNPTDARIRLFLGSFYRQLGLYSDALNELTHALELSPQKPSIMLELGVMYHDMGNATLAAEWIKKAHELEPRYDIATIFYAVIAIEADDTELTEALLIPRFGTVTPDDPYILQAYVAKNNYRGMAGVLENRAKGNPTDAEVLLQLAQVYFILGNKAGSIEQIRKAIELKPDLKERGESLINDIEEGRIPQ